MEKCIKFVSLFLLAFVFAGNTEAADTEFDMGIFLDFLKLGTKLKYGDSCSWEAEKSRLEMTERLFNFKGGSIFDKVGITMEFAKKVVKAGEPLCSALSLTVCNNETLTCQCGDPGKIVALGHDAGTKNYDIETTADGKRNCRWAEKSGCAPVDYLKQSTAIFRSVGAEINSECRQGTKCMSKATEGRSHSCSIRDILNYAVKTGQSDTESLSKAMFTGQICSCRADLEIESLDGSTTSDDRSEYDYSRGSRIKRLASLREPFLEAALASGISSSTLQFL